MSPTLLHMEWSTGIITSFPHVGVRPNCWCHELAINLQYAVFVINKEIECEIMILMNKLLWSTTAFLNDTRSNLNLVL